MNRKKLAFAVLALAAFLLTGCAMRTVEDMYALPKRSDEYSQLQNAIDYAMVGLDYAAPISGDHQQTVQTADLDGDGRDEYLVFASGSWENPLQVLIFKQENDGSCDLVDIIECNGSVFEQVEYAPFDEKDGMEIILGCQVSDQVLRSVSVYSLDGGSIQQLLLVGYTKFIACDMDENDFYELMVLRPGETETDPAVAVYYTSQAEKIHRSEEVALSVAPPQIQDICYGRLDRETPAVVISGAEAGDVVPTDILTLRQGRFANTTALAGEDSALRTLSTLPQDIDEDGILEFATRFSIRPVSVWSNGDEQSLLRWFCLDDKGKETDKLYTFHNFEQGWYLTLEETWAEYLSVVRGENVFTFYMWNEDHSEALALFSIYTLTGSNRNEAEGSDGQFLLHSTDSTVYAAKLEADAASYAITKDTITESFRLIRPDRRIH